MKLESGGPIRGIVGAIGIGAVIVGVGVQFAHVRSDFLEPTIARERTLGMRVSEIRTRVDVAYPAASNVEKSTIISRAARLNFALPWVDSAASVLDHGPMWSNWVAQSRPDMEQDVDELIEILQADVEDHRGRKVAQLFSPHGQVIAVRCGQQGAEVLYDPVAVAALTPLALRFLKQHEVGHLRASKPPDVQCNPDVVQSNYKEKDADCWAVKQLRRREVGLLAIGAAQEFFHNRNDPPTGNYMGSKSRARYLRNGCDARFKG